MTNCFRSAFIAAMAFAALLMMAPPASAQTEGQCDGEIGAEFGLCKSYCEAMDCDGDNPQATQKACTKVLDNWTKVTNRAIPCGGPGAGDPLLEGTTFDSICPWSDTTVATVCSSLGDDVTYVFPGSADPWPDPDAPPPPLQLSPGATSANICLCPDTATVTRTIRQCRTGQPDDPCSPAVDPTNPTPELLNVDSITDQRGGQNSCQWKTFNFLGTDYEVLLCT